MEMDQEYQADNAEVDAGFERVSQIWLAGTRNRGL